MDRQRKQSESKENLMEIELAINEEVKRCGLEFAELSITIRELLAKIYLRGAAETLKKLKSETYERKTS